MRGPRQCQPPLLEHSTRETLCSRLQTVLILDKPQDWWIWLGGHHTQIAARGRGFTVFTQRTVAVV